MLKVVSEIAEQIFLIEYGGEEETLSTLVREACTACTAQLDKGQILYVRSEKLMGLRTAEYQQQDKQSATEHWKDSSIAGNR